MSTDVCLINTNVCLMCNLEGTSCICDEVDAFFDDCAGIPRIAPTPEPKKERWVMIKSVMYAVFSLVLVAISGCGQHPGLSGKDGAPGSPGTPGVGVVYSSVSATLDQCPSGGSVVLMARDTNASGVLDASDSQIQSMTLCNGLQGSQGAPGEAGPAGSTSPPSQFTPTSVIQPCGASSSPWKEVLLVLQGGQVISTFSANASGLNTRLAFLAPGNYSDTDSSGCQFSYSISGHTGTVSWGAGSNQYAVWAAGSQSWTIQ